MKTTDKEEPKKTVYKETDKSNEELTNGETSSVSHLDRSSFTKQPARKNKPLGSGHEPGVMPGSE
ncbi:hypothetical protein [Pedobacter metabolipauper]|uniref:Uncharacterized protein n=1 Tax=Pedobacter metabolipauper TaxID=425513 RepID=A0A4R6SRG5_9SPHI|nr:hypothetical protein [Pedobacter metabolipauper]TDQ07022.1 hypothetical protein ATK78_4038 [Pedobacter metabolipauper]